MFPESAPLASIVTYDFPEHEGRPPVRLVWYDGGLKPPRPKHLEGAGYPGEGTMYVGDEGIMLGSTVYPLDRGRKFRDVPKTLPRRPGTWEEGIEAVRGGEPAGCNFNWAERITEFVCSAISHPHRPAAQLGYQGRSVHEQRQANAIVRSGTIAKAGSCKAAAFSAVWAIRGPRNPKRDIVGKGPAR